MVFGIENATIVHIIRILIILMYVCKNDEQRVTSVGYTQSVDPAVIDPHLFIYIQQEFVYERQLSSELTRAE